MYDDDRVRAEIKTGKYIDWNVLVSFRTLSEDFLREYQAQINFYRVILYQSHISNDFIWEFRDRMGKGSWKLISEFRSLKIEQINRFYEYLDLDIIEKRGIIGYDQLNSLKILKKLTE